ncbi:MAG: DEAD/DEAH box helicase [Pirellulales bacterium]|nr:DEAD/DEAH box helicase [Pirellulales bacterium]
MANAPYFLGAVVQQRTGEPAGFAFALAGDHFSERHSVTTPFSTLGLAEPFLRATAELGYEVATPIQAKAIPVVLAGRDLIGCAQTGTGKTAAFTLPMLDRLTQNRPARSDASQDQPRGPKGSQPKPRRLRALVLSPTRELAAQISESLKRYGQYTPLRHAVVYGGVSQHPQVKTLRHGVDALVATPGRLIDLMQQGFIDLKGIEILVFDEADQMLDMGFLPALKRIVAAVPADRQTLMFSATMPAAIRELAQQWLRSPASVEAARVGAPAERIAQSVFMVDKQRKGDLLTALLKSTPRGRTLVFSRTKHGADKLVKRLNRDGVRAAAIHGNKSQGARTRTLDQFKGNNPPVLVATDLAARGLDINEISHVYNFDLPEVADTYVHRIGRTARAGAEGIAVSFCSGDERGLLREIERLIKAKITVEQNVAGFEPLTPAPAEIADPSGGSLGRRGPARRPARQGGASRGGDRPAHGARAKTTGRPRRSKSTTTSAAAHAPAKPADGGASGRPRRRRRREL